MEDERRLLTALNDHIRGNLPLPVFVDRAADTETLQAVGAEEARAVACVLAELQLRDDATARTAAHVLVLAVEGIAEAKGDYDCEAAAVINDAVEAVFVFHGLTLDAARCRLFSAHVLAARSDFEEAIAAVGDLEPVLRVAGEGYALACALFLRAQCTLQARLSVSDVGRDLEEAFGLFRTHGDDARARACRELRGRFKLGLATH